MIKHFRLLLFSAALPLAAQVPNQPINPCIQRAACFFATVSGTVASSGTSILTIQQPATGARSVNFQAAIVTCDTQAFTVAQAQNGTGATATAGTAVALTPVQSTQGGTAIAAAAKVFTASNVGGGTTTAPTLPYPSGSIAVIDLSLRNMSASGIANNYTVTLTNTGASSCAGTVSIYWAEKI